MDKLQRCLLTVLALPFALSSADAADLRPKPAYQAQTLRQVLSEAMADNPEILQAQALKREQDYQVDIARRSFGPTVNVHVSMGTKRDNSLNDSLGNPNPRSDFKQFNWDVQQNVFNGFSTLNVYKQREANRRSAISDLMSTQNNVGQKVIQAYIGLYKQRRLRALSLDNVAKHRHTLRLTEKRFHAGASPSADLELARARLSRAEADASAMVRGVAAAEHAYVHASGRLPPRRMKLPTPPMQHFPKTLGQALALASYNNPVLGKERHKVASSRYAMASEQGVYYPSLDLKYLEERDKGLTSHDGMVRDKQISINLNYNLFRSGVDQARINAARQRIAMERARYGRVVRDVRQAIADHWSRILELKRNHRTLEGEVAANKGVVASYITQFQMGKRSIINVLDMESELYRTRTRLVNNDMTLLVTYYALLAETGTLFDNLPD